MCYGKSSNEPRLLLNPLSSQVAGCSLEVVAYYSGCFSSHNYGRSDYLATSLTLALIMILVPVLICITSILSLLLFIMMIHILCLLYYHLAQLIIHSTVLSSTRLADLPRIIESHSLYLAVFIVVAI